MPASGISRGASGNTLPGAPPRSWDPTYGGLPQVPAPGATAGTAIGSNIGNLGSLYHLAGGVNQFQENALLGNLSAGLPQYGALTAASSGNIMSNLKGQLPPDVINLIAQQAAERGIATGSPGSPNSDAAYLRALGLTSLDLQQKGESELTGAIGRTPVAQPFDLSRMMITPEQEQEAAMAANLYGAAPVPSRAATAGIGAFSSGLGAGMGAVGPGSVDYRMGPGTGGPGDWAMSMYNAPWASDAPNPAGPFGALGAGPSTMYQDPNQYNTSAFDEGAPPVTDEELFGF